MELSRDMMNFRQAINMFSVVISIINAEARTQSAKRFQLREMKHQIIQNDLKTIRRGHASDITSCALICVKDEKCISMSYDFETHDFVHSSGYPVMAGGNDENSTRLPDVYMKAQETLDFGPSGKYKRQHSELLSTLAVDQQQISIEDCANNCQEDCSCFGISYDPSNSHCGLFLHGTSDTASIYIGVQIRLEYRLINEEIANTTISNVAQGASIADSSPPFMEYYPEKIIDGIAEQAVTVANSFCNGDPYPYVTVDLGCPKTILYIVLWARPGNFFSQVDNMDFRISLTIADLETDSALCYYRPETPSVRPETFNCTSLIIGRYVRARRLAGSGYLCFTELEVYGYSN